MHRHWVPPLKRLEPGRGTGPWPQGGHADKGFREEAAFGRGLCCPWGQLGPWWEAQLDASQQLVDKKLMCPTDVLQPGLGCLSPLSPCHPGPGQQVKGCAVKGAVSLGQLQHTGNNLGSGPGSDLPAGQTVQLLRLQMEPLGYYPGGDYGSSSLWGG